uniref:G_PROTEIN_RECEP_F1_2 domain-containing protein n=1 Tax=Angiostrongylus cantonensis TaxID=6313 RepID=A0A0K0D4L7_ANGCA
MTIVLLAVPLVIMTVLYGSVIRTLKLGIRQEIAAVDSMDQECKCSVSAVDKFKVLKELSKKLYVKLDHLINILPDSTDDQFDGNLQMSEAPQVENTLRSTHIQKSALAKQRVIRMLIVVVIIFFCCWTPSYIWWLLLMAGDSFEKFRTAIYVMFGKKKNLRHHFEKVCGFDRYRSRCSLGKKFIIAVVS